MGHKLVRKGYSLKFADGSPLDGAQIVLGSLSIGQIMQVRQLMHTVSQSTSPVEQMEAFDTVILMAADKLVSWDLEEEDGTPIPATREGVLSLDGELMLPIINAWLDAAKGTDAPLPDASSDGERQTLEASIPMELPSTDLAS